MKKIRDNVLALTILLVAPLATADQHKPSSSSTVELWVCNYQDGKTIDDLRDWYKDFNILSDQMKNGKFRSWLWTPVFVSDLTAADVVVATAFPSLESMGQSMMEFFGGKETGELFARYQTIVDCHGRELWTVEQMRK